MVQKGLVPGVASFHVVFRGDRVVRHDIQLCVANFRQQVQPTRSIGLFPCMLSIDILREIFDAPEE